MNNKRKVLILSGVWIGAILTLAVIYKAIIKPATDKQAMIAAEAARERMLQSTSGESRYKDSVTISLDPFGGYFALRSETFLRELAAEGIKLSLVNEPNQGKRLASIGKGDCQFASFTIDALIQHSSEDYLPATIIATIDSRPQATDVLAVSRGFLAKNKETSKKVLKCYFRALYADREGLAEALNADAVIGGDATDRDRIETIIKEVKWENLLDNYARFGIRRDLRISNIEDVIDGTIRSLILSKAISRDPTGANPGLLYYGQILKELDGEKFHPGDTLKGIEPRKLSDSQWGLLREVKDSEAPVIRFGRGSHQLSRENKSLLDGLAKNLATFNSHYVTIKGDASKAGDPEANKSLSLRRAEVIAEYLKNSGGISANRIRAIGGEPSGSPSARFILGQEPY